MSDLSDSTPKRYSKIVNNILVRQSDDNLNKSTKIPVVINSHARKKRSLHKKALSLHRQPEHSKTLMRKSVAKPTVTKKLIRSVQSRAGESANVTSLKILTKRRGINIEKITHAQQVSKSHKVSHFKETVIRPVTPKLQHIPVVQPSRRSSINKSSEKIKTNQSDLATILKDGLVKATSFSSSNSRVEKTQPRVWHFVFSAIIPVVLIGFVVYQNLDRINFKIASTRAGIPAQMPGYKPAGFIIKGPVQYGSGIVRLNYQSTTDQRTFTLIQQSSNWDDQMLLDNYIKSVTLGYQVIHVSERTVYVFGNTNASWVSGGVWYELNGNATLSADQIANIVSST